MELWNFDCGLFNWVYFSQLIAGFWKLSLKGLWDSFGFAWLGFYRIKSVLVCLMVLGLGSIRKIYLSLRCWCETDYAFLALLKLVELMLFWFWVVLAFSSLVLIVKFCRYFCIRLFLFLVAELVWNSHTKDLGIYRELKVKTVLVSELYYLWLPFLLKWVSAT